MAEIESKGCISMVTGLRDGCTLPRTEKDLGGIFWSLKLLSQPFALSLPGPHPHPQAGSEPAAGDGFNLACSAQSQSPGSSSSFHTNVNTENLPGPQKAAAGISEEKWRLCLPLPRPGLGLWYLHGASGLAEGILPNLKLPQGSSRVGTRETSERNHSIC